MRRVFERVAVVEGEIGIFPDFERAGAARNSEKLRGIESDARERTVEAQAIARGDGRFEEDDPGLRHVALVTALEGKRNAGGAEFRGRFNTEIFRVGAAAGHRGVQDDRKAARLDFVEHQWRVGAAVENDLEAKLLCDAQGGENILLTMGVDQEGLLTGERPEERLGPEVARRAFGLIFGGLFLGVFLRLDQFGAQHRDSFGARAGSFRRRSAGTRHDFGGGEAVATQGDGGHRGRVDHILVGAAPKRFDDHGLAGRQRIGRVTGIDRGDTQGAHPRDERVLRVVGVDRPELGLERRGFLQLILVVGLVENARETDRRVGVDQTGRDHGGGDRPITGGNLRRGGGTDSFDLAVAEEYDGIFQRRARNRIHRAAGDGDVFGVRCERAGEDRQRKRGNETGESFHWLAPLAAAMRSQALVKQHRCARCGLPAPGPPTACRRSSGRDRSKLLRPSIHVCSTCV